jgi:hypothetical protein
VIANLVKVKDSEYKLKKDAMALANAKELLQHWKEQGRNRDNFPEFAKVDDFYQKAVLANLAEYL